MKKIVISLLVLLIFLSTFSILMSQINASIHGTEWTQTYGGSGVDGAYSVIQTSDGGYAIAGDTISYGGGYDDFWLVKTNSDGTKQWSQTYGGSDYERARDVAQTSDGGYIIAGYILPYGPGFDDFWVVKTDSSGTTQWSKTYGGSGVDRAYSVVQTSDGGYIIAGYTGSFGAGGNDFYVVKTYSSGNVQWSQTYGGSSHERARSILQTSDGGYIIAGCTNTYGSGNYDFWLVKTNSDGTKQWSQTYGGSNMDMAYSVQQTADGGYAIAGDTMSYGAGETDFWLVKTNSDGTKQWSQTYGGSAEDTVWSSVHTADAGYIIVGDTSSYGSGQEDFWVVKTDSSGNKEWSQAYGGSAEDRAASVQQTADMGYIIAGRTSSYGSGQDDFWLIKLEGESPDGEITDYVVLTPEVVAGNKLRVQVTVDNIGVIRAEYNVYIGNIWDSEGNSAGNAYSESHQIIQLDPSTNQDPILEWTTPDTMPLGAYTGDLHLQMAKPGGGWEKHKKYPNVISFTVVPEKPTVTVDPNGGRVYVDDSPITSRTDYTWDIDSVHSLDPDSGYEPDPSTKLNFDRWDDGNEDDPRQVKVTGDATYTALWDTQYLVTFQQSGCGDTPHVTVDGQSHTLSYSEWMDSGSSHDFTYESPVAEEGKQWDLTSTSHASPITVTGPTTITGHYSQTVWSFEPNDFTLFSKSKDADGFAWGDDQWHADSDSDFDEMLGKIEVYSWSRIDPSVIPGTPIIISASAWAWGRGGIGCELDAPFDGLYEITMRFTVKGELSSWIFLPTSYAKASITLEGSVLRVGMGEVWTEELWEKKIYRTSDSGYFGESIEESFSLYLQEGVHLVYALADSEVFTISFELPIGASAEAKSEFRGDGGIWLEEIEVRLVSPEAQTASLGVSILDFGGSPMAESELSGLIIYQDSFANIFEEIAAETNTYTWDSLPPGHNYLVEVYANDMVSGASDWIVLESPGTSKTTSIITNSPSFLKVKATQSDGITPLSDAYVEVRSHKGNIWRSDYTDVNGETAWFVLQPTTITGEYYQTYVFLAGEQVGVSESITLSLSEYIQDVVTAEGERIITTTEAPTLSILFDERRAGMDTLDYEYSDIAQLLQEKGHIAESTTEPLTDTLLAGYGILVITCPYGAYAQAELEAIESFVSSGGGLLLMGQWSISDPTGINQVAGLFGVNFLGTGAVRDPDMGVDAFMPVISEFNIGHTVCTGVGSIGIYGGRMLSIGSNTPLAWGDENTYGDLNNNGIYDTGEPLGNDTIVMAAAQLGWGKAVFISDTDLFDNDFLQENDNQDLFFSIIGWLATSAESTLVISAHSPVDILITDPSGARVGYDSLTSQIVNEIPGATYSGPGTDPQVITIPAPSQGVYIVDRFGTGIGTYTIIIESKAPDGTIVQSETWTGTASPGETDRGSIQLFEDGTFAEAPHSVIPEVPWGTIVASASIIIALAAYVAMPKWRRKREYVNL